MTVSRQSPVGRPFCGQTRALAEAADKPRPPHPIVMEPSPSLHARQGFMPQRLPFDRRVGGEGMARSAWRAAALASGFLALSACGERAAPVSADDWRGQFKELKI